MAMFNSYVSLPEGNYINFFGLRKVFPRIFPKPSHLQRMAPRPGTCHRAAVGSPKNTWISPVIQWDSLWALEYNNYLSSLQDISMDLWETL